MLRIFWTFFNTVEIELLTTNIVLVIYNENLIINVVFLLFLDEFHKSSDLLETSKSSVTLKWCTPKANSLQGNLI